MLEFIFETTRSVTNLILQGVPDRYPNIRFIVPHAGAALPVLAGRIELLLPMLSAPNEKTPPCVRSALLKLHYDLAGAPVPEFLGALLKVADPSRILYGSDFPFTPLAVCELLRDELVNSRELDETSRAQILAGNARRLLCRPPRST